MFKSITVRRWALVSILILFSQGMFILVNIAIWHIMPSFGKSLYETKPLWIIYSSLSWILNAAQIIVLALAISLYRIATRIEKKG